MEEVRKLSRLALPADDTYLLRLGVVTYGFASVNSFMCEIIAHIDPQYNHTILQDKSSSVILSVFRQKCKELRSNKRLATIHVVMRDTADLFEKLNYQRNDIIHAYPITNELNEQILHRRKDSINKYFEVTSDFLDDFISRLHDVSLGLYTIRDIVENEK